MPRVRDETSFDVQHFYRSHVFIWFDFGSCGTCPRCVTCHCAASRRRFLAKEGRRRNERSKVPVLGVWHLNEAEIRDVPGDTWEGDWPGINRMR